jgi:hypothetical protein
MLGGHGGSAAKSELQQKKPIPGGVTYREGQVNMI